MINVLLRAFFIQEGLKCEKQKSKQVCRESSWCRSIAARADSVSYTHLDVYKRQEDDRETLKKLPERLAAYEKAVAAVKPE